MPFKANSSWLTDEYVTIDESSIYDHIAKYMIIRSLVDYMITNQSYVDKVVVYESWRILLRR